MKDDRIIPEEIREKVVEITAAAFKAKDKGHDIFLEYSPHVQSLVIRGYIGGWVGYTNPTWETTVYLTDKFYKVEDTLRFLDLFLGKIQDLEQMEV